MALLPVFVTTTKLSHNKKKPQQSFKEQHSKLLKKVGYSGRKQSLPKTRVVQSRPKLGDKTSNKIPVGVATKSKPMEYSGERQLLGIATMHKSNMVPVFSKSDAEDISKMRR